MTLNDIMKPNKFGTEPMLYFLNVGTASVNKEVNMLDVRLVNTSPLLIPMDTEVKVHKNRITIMCEKLMGFSVELVYWNPLTPEQILIHNAIERIILVTVVSSSNNFVATRMATDNLLAGLLHDGTGWIDLGYGAEPAAFYVEDILYRLDLQGKLT